MFPLPGPILKSEVKLSASERPKYWFRKNVEYIGQKLHKERLGYFDFFILSFVIIIDLNENKKIQNKASKSILFFLYIL